MQLLPDRLFGVPLSAAATTADLADLERTNDARHNIDMFAARLEHLTSKSGALLQADSIFFAAGLFLVQGDRWRSVKWSLFLTGWSAIVLMTLSSVLLAMNLWAGWPRPASEGDGEQFRRIYYVRQRRAHFFNIALLMFFAGVLLLALRFAVQTL